MVDWLGSLVVRGIFWLVGGVLVVFGHGGLAVTTEAGLLIGTASWLTGLLPTVVGVVLVIVASVTEVYFGLTRWNHRWYIAVLRMAAGVALLYLVAIYTAPVLAWYVITIMALAMFSWLAISGVKA